MPGYADLSMSLNMCSDRLSFVADFFDQSLASQKQLCITYESACGLIWILDDVKAHLRSVDDLAKELITTKREV